MNEYRGWLLRVRASTTLPTDHRGLPKILLVYHTSVHYVKDYVEDLSGGAMSERRNFFIYTDLQNRESLEKGENFWGK